MTTLLMTILVLGALIFVHELGHFLVAKRARVGVLKFSLGFGPKLVGVKRGETEYLLSALPLGGYVKMVGEDPTDDSPEASDPAKSFSRKSVGARAAIILAGPVSNLLLPVAIFWGIFAFVGQSYFPPVAGTPDADSPAARAGLVAGDRIRAVDGVAVERWDEVDGAVRGSQGRSLTLSIARQDRLLEVTAEPRALKTADIFGQEVEVWSLGLRLLLPSRIGQVMPGQPAQQAGLQGGDRIVAVGAQPVSEWEQLARIIHGSPGKPLTLAVEREGRRFDVEVTPRAARQQTAGREEEIGLIGIGPGADTLYRRLDPFAALLAGVKKTADITLLTVQGFVKLVQAKISPKTIGGPILIAQMTGEVAQRGLMELLSFTALLSINLGILNLLPIPVLDGGHLLFAFIEWARGKPVSLRKREIAQQVGLVLLVALMVFAFYNDIFRLLGRS